VSTVFCESLDAGGKVQDEVAAEDLLGKGD